MSRLAPVQPDSATGRVKEIFDGPLKGKHFNIFKSMGNSAAVLEAFLGMSGALAKAGLTEKEREIVQLAIGQANNCGYCLAAHTAMGKGAGLSEGQTIEARRGHLGDARLNAVASFALAIHEKNGHVSDTDLSAFKAAGFNDGHVGEVVAVYALAVFTNYFNHVNDTPVDLPAAPAV